MDPVHGPGPYRWSMDPVQKGVHGPRVHVLSSPNLICSESNFKKVQYLKIDKHLTPEHEFIINSLELCMRSVQNAL